ncbi:MAG: hypothetical protein ACLVLH_18800 [Eisenbergiella massiliensis]
MRSVILPEPAAADGGIGMSWNRDGSAHELNGTAGAFLILPQHRPSCAQEIGTISLRPRYLLQRIP